MTAVSAADEVLDVVDRDDRVTGQAPRGEVYARGLLHRCVFVLARNAEGRIFVHRRTASKLVFPSAYDMFVGGVLGAGEEYAEAALREAEEELGVSGLGQPEPLLKFLYEGPGGAWWSYVHEVRLRAAGVPAGVGGGVARVAHGGGAGGAGGRRRVAVGAGRAGGVPAAARVPGVPPVD